LFLNEVIESFQTRYDVDLEEIPAPREDVTFNLPRVLAI
jgi:hypothetical protein